MKHIICVDNDDYDPSNLTRQILGSLTDCGRRKVDVAADGLKFHNLRSCLEFEHFDAVRQWHRVVAIARRSDVVFNCCDAGGLFDFAVASLCKQLSVPYVAGSSFMWSIEVEFYELPQTCGLPREQ